MRLLQPRYPGAQFHVIVASRGGRRAFNAEGLNGWCARPSRRFRSGRVMLGSQQIEDCDAKLLTGTCGGLERPMEVSKLLKTKDAVCPDQDSSDYRVVALRQRLAGHKT
jgi:hypothetical protein